MNPALRRLLFGLFLSLPGMLLTVMGACGAAFSVIALLLEPDFQGNLRLFAYIVGSALMFGVGTCMGTIAEMLNAGERTWRAKPPRLVFTRIGQMVLALLSACAAVAGMGYLEHRMWIAALAAFLASGLLFLIILAIQNPWNPFTPKKEPDQS